MLEQILVALVGFFRRGEAGEHTHRPQLAAVPGSVNAAGVGRLARITQILFVIPIGGQIGLRIETANRDIRDRAEPGVAVLVEIGASRSSDGFFGSFLQRGRKRLFRPLFFRCRWMATFKHIGHRTFCNGLARFSLRLILGHALPHAQSIIEEPPRKRQGYEPTEWLALTFGGDAMPGNISP